MYSNVARFVVSVGIRRALVRACEENLLHDSDALILACLTAAASVDDPAFVFVSSLGPKRVPHRTVYADIRHTTHERTLRILTIPASASETR